MESFTQLVADDTQIYAKTNSNIDKNILQEELEKLKDYSLKWNLKFNTSKCRVMYIGKQNNKFQ